MALLTFLMYVRNRARGLNTLPRYASPDPPR